MRTSIAVRSGLGALGLALSACNPFHQAPVTEVTRDLNVNARWRASLVTPSSLGGAVQMNGTATMQPAGSETVVTIALANATPGGVHPWHVHRGQCGDDYGVLGDASAYSAFKIGDDGKGSSKVTLRLMTPTSGSYFVDVQASAANPETIVACGNLAPPAM